LVADNFSSGNVNATTATIVQVNTTSANTTTLVSGNFSSGNARITGGYADNFAIGANTAATGTFTNLIVNSYANVAGVIVANANISTAYLSNAAPTTAAVVVSGTGGLIVGGNAWIGQGVVINGQQNAHNTIIRGQDERGLFQVMVADAGYEQVIIGGNLVQANTIPGAKLIVNSTDAMIIPTGSSGQRPGNSGYTDVTGMIRFNTTSGDLEYYDGSNWKTTGAVFTIINTRVFSAASGDPNGNVDGTNLTFTLPAETSTNSVIVSVNGVLQTPVTTYTVTGDQLVFTEAPVLGDEVEARSIQTTNTISGLQDPTGYNGFEPNANGLELSTGNASLGGSFVNWQVTVYGDLISPTNRSIGNLTVGVGNVYMQGATISNAANTAVASSNILTTIDSFNKAAIRSAKYVVQASGTGGNYQNSEVLVVHDDTVALATVYSVVETGANVGVVNATVSGSNVLVQYVAANAGTNVRISKQYMPI
jgi:hypothetical protein